MAIFIHQKTLKVTSKLENKIGLLKDFYYCILLWCYADVKYAIIHFAFAQLVARQHDCAKKFGKVKLRHHWSNGPCLWPPISSDLSPDEYRIYGHIKMWCRIMHIRCHGWPEKWLTNTWDSLSKSIIDDTIDWMVNGIRLQACVRETAGYCEQLL